MKEESINRKLRERFEAGLEKISKAIHVKHGVKSYDKVQNKIGALQEKYPSISRYYDIKVEKGDSGKVASVTCGNQHAGRHGIWHILPQNQREDT